MANLKSLAKDTAIYGLSSIVGRFLNYLLVPLYTAKLSAESGGYGVITNMYAYTALLLVILTYGMETTFFRFANKEGEDPQRVYSTILISVGATSAAFVALVLAFIGPLSAFMGYADHPSYVWVMAMTVAIDAFQCIPFFTVFGIANWKVLALVWAAVPIFNGVLFATAPIYPLNPEGGAGLTLKELCRNKVFWLLMLMMLGAGAAENTVSQWASAFAEEGLGVTKTVGDLAGPMAFAALMGTARLIYGKWGHKLHLEKCMLGSSLLCVAAYLAIALVPNPLLSLVGCAVCGFSVGILWPGTFSKGAAAIPKGGTVMFALFALAGDLGCSAGPTLAGVVTRVCDGNMRRGILAGIVFPLLLVLCLVFGKKRKAAAGNAQAETNRSHGYRL